SGLIALGEDLPEHHASQHAVSDSPAGNRVDHPRGVADQGHAIADRLLDWRCGRNASGDHVERLGVSHPRILFDPAVQVAFDVDAILEAIQGDADADVRGGFILGEDPDVARRGARAEPEFAVVWERVALANRRKWIWQRPRAVS